MTVALSIKVYDGLVLASDSAATMTAPVGPNGGRAVVNVYNNANKIFNLHRGLAIGGMVWGAGSIGPESIATLVKDLRMRFEGRAPSYRSWEVRKTTFKMEDIAERVRHFLFEEHYRVQYRKAKKNADKPSLGFMVAGYSSRSNFAEEWLIEIENGKCGPPTQVRPTKECGWTAYGAPEPIHRLLFGYSPCLEEVFKDKFGIPVDQLPVAMRIVKAELEVPVVLPPMPIQDVIDLAEFLVHLSSMYYRFRMGTQIVGGPTEVAAITKHEGFKWIKRKYYYDRGLNPLRREYEHEDFARQGATRKSRKRSAKGMRA